MKITYIAITTGITACLLVAASALHADDKDKNTQTTSSSSSTAKGLSKATDIVTRITPATTSVSNSTTTVTAQQIANRENAKAKARETGARIDRINVPSPVRKVDTRKNLNPNNDPNVALGLKNKN